VPLRPPSAPVVLALVALIAVAAGCGSGATRDGASSGSAGAPAPAPARIEVVAAENFWGSIAAQLGGDRVDVVDVIASPDTDPHDYEPTPQDSRTVAQADYVIANGVGYDPWATKLVDANPVSGRRVLDVGDLVGARPGDNPHRWYFPADVERVIDQITADYQAIDPADAAYFDEQRHDFETTALAPYHQALQDIRRRFAGTPVGASESIFVGLADATGLDLVTPPAYLTAISEGTDPTARDKASVDAQIHDGVVKVFVFNSQNATPDVQALVDAADAADIPVATITETPPSDGTFQAWQTGQLEALAAALARATGR